MVTKDQFKTIAARILRAKKVDPTDVVEQLVSAFVEEAFLKPVAAVLDEVKTEATAQGKEVAQALREGFREALHDYVTELAGPPAGTGT